MKNTILIFLLCFASLSSFAIKKYVKPSGTGNGTSWANASGDLRAILSASSATDTIWVAKGTYMPTNGPDRFYSFIIKSNHKVFGGFVGNEPANYDIRKRNMALNESILSGDIGTVANDADNSHHVVTTTGVSDQTIIDGFTIRDGNGAGGSFFGNGGGWLNDGTSSASKPLLRNIKFIANKGASGAAMYNNGFGGEASPTYINCVFAQNIATANGGAVYNRATIGIASATFANCTFYNNEASGEGGAIYNFNNVSSPLVNLYIISCIFWENKSNTTINNDFFSENYRVFIFNSLVQAATALALNAGNSSVLVSDFMKFNQNPKFINSSLLDLRVELTSPAINSGGFFINQSETDILGISRVLDGVIDMGAYECPSKIYVNEAATGTDGGVDWPNATHDLQKALKAAVPNTEIWVAAGTYKPTNTTERTISFQIPDSVKVYGGFVGNESNGYDLSLRNFSANETILSGDIGIQNDSTDNTNHVILTLNVSSETLVDGLTITKGNANGTTFLQKIGGGWLNAVSGNGNNSNPTLTNCTFSFNSASAYGGAMYNDGVSSTSSSPTLTNCSFAFNSADDGGAMYNEGISGKSNPTLNNCSFTSNTAFSDGGAIYWAGDQGDVSSQLTNCVFNSNGKEHCYYDDGDEDKQPKFLNCTFYGATTRVIRTVFDNGATPVDFTNCIFWNNNGDIATDNTHVNITYSIVEEVLFTQAPYAGNNNINQDPQFVGATIGIFNLRCNSPAINAGTTGGSPTTDITGFIRVGNPDMGAYEFGHAEVENDIASGANPILNGTPYIKASSKILNTNNALYQGALFVEMLPGFEVAPNMYEPTVFKAEVGGGCI